MCASVLLCFTLNQSSCRVLRLDEAGTFSYQVALQFPLLPTHWTPPWLVTHRGVTYPAEILRAEHASHSSSVTPGSYFGQRKEWRFFLLNLRGKLGERVSAFNSLAHTPLSSSSLWRTFLLGLLIPAETGSQNHLDLERLAEITCPTQKP